MEPAAEDFSRQVGGCRRGAGARSIGDRRARDECPGCASGPLFLYFTGRSPGGAEADADGTCPPGAAARAGVLHAGRPTVTPLGGTAGARAAQTTGGRLRWRGCRRQMSQGAVLDPGDIVGPSLGACCPFGLCRSDPRVLASGGALWPPGHGLRAWKPFPVGAVVTARRRPDAGLSRAVAGWGWSPAGTPWRTGGGECLLQTEWGVRPVRTLRIISMHVFLFCFFLVLSKKIRRRQNVKPAKSVHHGQGKEKLMLLFWADKDDVWNNLMKKEKTYLRDRHFLERHPLLQPKMRAILLDWLMEVCEVYRLHRETFYLAQDYFDRFMATQKNVVKTRLQLIGITALFVAAKLEEIYPPKLNQFAYVTDGACTEDEILEMELIMMKELKWSLNPLTVMSWLNIYMQVAYLKDETPSDEVLIPQFPQTTFVQISKLIDLCILDVGSLDFSYGVLAASALFHFSSLELVQKVSGLSWKEIEDSVKWMVPFAMSVKEMGNTKLKCFKGIPVEDSHNIQTHSTLLGWLDKVYEYRESHLDDNRISPVPSGVLTPPQSSEKSELLKS
ncbi:CCNE1 protein, partial [Polypterus senegalus]